MRQENAVFAQALNHLAVGRLTAEEIGLFKDRIITDPNYEFPPGTIHLFRSNDLVDQFNENAIKNLPDLAPACDATHECTGNAPAHIRKRALETARTWSAQKAQGLPQTLQFKLGARYLMTINVSTEDGLVNGASGVLRHVSIASKIVDGHIVDRAEIMWVEFDSPDVGAQARILYYEKAVCENIPLNLTPITKIKKTLTNGLNNNYNLTRKHFPVVYGEAITIYKGQGSSFKNVAVHISPRLPSVELYVGCSRATTREGLFLVPTASNVTFEAPFPRSANHNVEKELRRLESLPSFFTLPTWPKNQNCLKVIYHNVEGLQSKMACTFTDANFRDADIAIFSETRDKEHIVYDFAAYGFRQVSRIPGTGRHGSGTVVAVRQDLHAVEGPQTAWTSRSGVEEDGRFARVEICSTVVGDVIVFGVYFSPKATKKANRKLREMVIQAKKKTEAQKMVVLGDFNSDVMAGGDPKQIVRVMEMQSFHGCIKHISPTKNPTTNLNTQLDLVFSSVKLNARAMVHESTTSYHKPVMAVVNFETTTNAAQNQPQQPVPLARQNQPQHPVAKRQQLVAKLPQQQIFTDITNICHQKLPQRPDCQNQFKQPMAKPPKTQCSTHITKPAHKNAPSLQSANQHTENNFKAVMFSDLHQANLENAQLAGNQCTFMSLTAILYSSLVKSFPQSKNDIFQILKCGNSYYESNMKEILESHPAFFANRQSFHTGPSDIRLKNIKIFGKKVVIRTGEDAFAVGLYESEINGVKNIGDTLREFIDGKLNTTALAICGAMSRAVMKRTNDGVSTYYLFDSHQFDSRTAFMLQRSLPGDRNAAFVAFDTADALVRAYQNLVPNMPGIQMELTEILCEINENGNDANFSDIDNYNQSENLNLRKKLERRFTQHEQERNSKSNEFGFFKMCYIILIICFI